MITVTVTAPRGEGSTTTALRIVRLLRSLGFPVEYQGHSKAQSRQMERLLRDCPDDVTAGAEPRTFLVRDPGAQEGDLRQDGRSPRAGEGDRKRT